MKKKILIVDDAHFMQKIMTSMLSDSYETICAASGEEAMELYEREKPDLILTDLIMKGMTGLELQQALREKYQEHIPIIFMSADENEENEVRGLEGGAMDYIRKPFKQEVLLRRVDNVIRHVDRIRGLQIAAETDPMTGLLNKANSQKVLTRMCARSTGVLMMVDLDSFKLVNDLYGHAMGDKILIRFADILRSVIRTSDVAGRMGGDEFIVFCQDVTEESLVKDKARQINDQIFAAAKEYMGEDMNIPLGASVGAVEVPKEGTDFHELFEKADKALYEVKQNGKHGCALYHSAMSRASGEAAHGPGTSVENLRVILEERNRQPGAFQMGFENFRCVYRYLIRCIENYHRPMELIHFAVELDKADGRDLERVSDAFREAMAKSLRRSDIYMESGKGRYLVLLSEMRGENEDVIISRVMSNWEKSGVGTRADISYESLVIE